MSWNYYYLVADSNNNPYMLLEDSIIPLFTNTRAAAEFFGPMGLGPESGSRVGITSKEEAHCRYPEAKGFAIDPVFVSGMKGCFACPVPFSWLDN
jgi:hypothetical protein